MDVGQLLTLLLGGGATATIVAVFSGIKSLKEGSRSKERDTISDLVERRKESDDERDRAVEARDRAIAERDYWRNRCGVREYQLNFKGIPLEPFIPPPSFNPEVM